MGALSNLSEMGKKLVMGCECTFFFAKKGGLNLPYVLDNAPNYLLGIVTGWVHYPKQIKY